MEDKKIPYLCGGTLFFLLVQARKPRTMAREREKGVSDGLNDPSMMEGLLNAVTGNYDAPARGSTFKKNTSQFRECKINGSTYILFNDPATANSYDYDVTHNYNEVLLRMSEFAERFLNRSKSPWLVRVLLDVIEQDAGISDDAHFYVQSDGIFLSKSDVMSEKRFYLQPFLVGIVHYILMNRSDNISGQDTLDAWGTKKSERSERKLKNDFSLGVSRDAKVDWCKSDKEASTEDTVETDHESEVNTEFMDRGGAVKERNPSNIDCGQVISIAEWNKQLAEWKSNWLNGKSN